MQTIIAVTIGSISAYIGLLVLVVIGYALVLRFAGRVLHASGPIGIGSLVLLAIFLAVFASGALAGPAGFVIAITSLFAMFLGWFLYATGNPNYNLRSSTSKLTSTGHGEPDIKSIERNGSRIKQEDSVGNEQPGWVKYVRGLGVVALIGLIIYNALGGLSVGLYIFVGMFLVFVVLPFTILIMRSRLAMMSTSDKRSRLAMSIRSNTFPDPGVFTNLHWRNPGGIQRSNRLIAGHLSLTNEGLEWTPARRVLPAALRTPFIAGEMKIPWNWIETITIGRDARVLLPIGGYLSIELSDSRGSIDGRYLGSRPLFTKALQATPLGGKR